MKFSVWTVSLMLCLAGSAAFAFERVPHEVVRALGTSCGKPVPTGLVFINGKYMKPPYRVTRAGNQIQINCYPVTAQLIAWEDFLKTQPPSRVTVTEVEESAPASMSVPTPQPEPEQSEDDPAAPKDGGNAPPPAEDATSSVRVVIESTRYAAGADDLEDFKPNEDGTMKLSDIPPDSEEDKARQKRAEEDDEDEETPARAETKNGRGASSDESGDGIDPASPEGEAAAKAAAEQTSAVVKRTRKVYALEGAFEENARSRKLVKSIDAYRERIEAALRRGGYVFFGTNPAMRYCQGLRTDSVLTNELLKKLPELMARSSDVESFCDEVRAAGLMNYINLQIARDLYRHKVDSVYLKQRRRELAEEDKLKKMMNNGR